MTYKEWAATVGHGVTINRVCIAHKEECAKKIVRALDADERKQSAIKRGFGKSPLREYK